ncbi:MULTISPECIES: hypothetical protein [Bradyrhizobium]|nr:MULTISPECIES: hypothetical protein [Bradyrhizobium]UFW53761.1 hypothetical protein BaraCB756_10350 [Bradyrhizobium arachidis]
MRYTGPNADYPVYCCRSDRDQQGSALCQEVRALAVDALVERVVLDALMPDQIEIALAAARQLEQESRQLERQWAVRVERARYEAERARRQYDAVEPENRLVARSLERACEEKLRVVEAVEQEQARWRAQEPLLIGPAERAGLQALGENLPRIWNAATTSAADRKRILRFVIREVVLDQKRTRGQVWLKIVWQTGATSEHHVQRRVHTYRNYIDIDRLRQRIVELNAEHKMDGEIAATLNQEGFVAARGCVFKGENVWVLRTRWGIPTVKINGVDKNPMRWPDGSFSIQGAAAELGVTRKPYSIISRADCWPAASWPKASHGRSSSQTSKLLSFATGYDAPSVRRRMHHEVIGSPMSTCHWSTGSWLVTMVER